jgi:DNA processing protein
MQLTLGRKKDPFENSIEPLKEMAAYEALWERYGVTFKDIARLFARNPGSLPSDLVSEKQILTFLDHLSSIFVSEKKGRKPNVLVNSSFDYPKKLRDAREPVEVLYYHGDLSLIETRSIAVVGSRHPSDEGRKRAQKLVRHLVGDKITIVSGLATGIDTEAHRTAIEWGGETIGVIGTPLNEYYPRENKDLQDVIAEKYLLISQVPFFRYSQQDYRVNRGFFPERNKTMSALTLGTVIVEASDTSGTLIQAKAALEQGRKLFILESCFQNPKITWPKRFEEKGAIRVRDYQDIKTNLGLDGIQASQD